MNGSSAGASVCRRSAPLDISLPPSMMHPENPHLDTVLLCVCVCAPTRNGNHAHALVPTSTAPRTQPASAALPSRRGRDHGLAQVDEAIACKGDMVGVALQHELLQPLHGAALLHDAHVVRVHARILHRTCMWRCQGLSAGSDGPGQGRPRVTGTRAGRSQARGWRDGAEGGAALSPRFAAALDNPTCGRRGRGRRRSQRK